MDPVTAPTADSTLAELKAQFIAYLPELADVIELESEPAHKLLQLFAYEKVNMQARINDAARACMLAYAAGPDLDHLAALLAVPALRCGANSCTAANDYSTASSASPNARDVAKFVEKPNIAKARKYVESGDYLWNAGMFIAQAAVLLAELAKTEPELHASIIELAAAWDTEERKAAIERIWPKLKKVAIDYSVAEPAAAAGLAAVVPANFSWHDVGDFAAIAELQSQGRKGNLAVLGNAKVLADSSSGILVSDTDRLIALIGVEDIIVVDTPDALLVTTKEHAQRVKSLVDALKATGHSDVL